MRIGQGLLVRPFRHDDAESFYQAVKESVTELSYWMPWCKPNYSLQDAVGWIAFCERAWEQGTEFPLGVFEISSGRLVGGTGINHINSAYRIGNVGYWVATPFTGRGFARTAARMTASIGFSDLGFTRLEIAVLTHNRASQKVADALGASRECISRNRLYFEGRPHDAILYSLIPDDIRSGQNLNKIEPVVQGCRT
jgi:RimJ/RimL family protein N-acetyltransferase